MKERFRELVGKIEEIEKLFHKTAPPPGLVLPTSDKIGDVPEFQIWLQEVLLEVQDIVDRTGDSFAADTLHALTASFGKWNDRRDFNNIKGKLLAMDGNIDKYYVVREQETERPPKIFISHSSKDVEYVTQLVSLLECMGLGQTQIFCSSLPGYDIPVGKDIFDFLREQFRKYSLHVIIVHSANYYQSPVCLNEMGAAWVLRSNCTSFLLPGFGFDGMCGVVNQNVIAIKLDNTETELQDKLNQLYDMIVEEFDLIKKDTTIWERKRNSFIREVKDIKVEATNKEAEASDIEMNKRGLMIKKI